MNGDSSVTNRTLFTSIIAASAMSFCAPGGAATRTADTILNTLQRSHPRLILTNERVDEMKTLAENDELFAKGLSDVLSKAKETLKKPPLVHKLVGPRLLSVSRECLDRVYTLGVAWRMTDERLFADGVRDNLLTVCAFPDWNPSHFLDTAEMSHAVGVGYDWIINTLDDATRDTISKGLIRHGLVPGADCYSGKLKASWINTTHNWNQVCNSGLAIGALAIAETDPKHARLILPEAIERLPKAIANYDPDGAWGEGPGYWSYASRYTVYGLHAMETALGTDFGLSDSEGLSEAGMFPLLASGPTDLYINFADVGANSKRRNLPCLFWLAKRYDAPALAHAEREMMRERPAEAQDLVWYEPAGGAVPELPLDAFFDGPVPLGVFRGSWGDPHSLFVGVKAGYNQVNHGHLDLGQFEVDALGERWVRDLGSDNYNLPGYWDKKEGGRRWTYYRLGSYSHSVPLINGRQQSAKAKAKVVSFQSDEKARGMLVDLTSAYAPEATSVRRYVAVDTDARSTLIQDEFVLSEECDLSWGLLTDAKIKVDGSRALLTIGEKQVEARLLSPAGARFETEATRETEKERPNKGVTRLFVTLKAKAGPVRVTVQLAPVWPDGGAADEWKVEALPR